MKATNKANLGMSFEALIETANLFYFDQGLAAIVKLPTAFKILRRYNPQIKRSEIVSAYPEKKSTVDFMGQYLNIPIAFEAKSTSNKTNFPLQNIQEHQIKWLHAVDKLGGKAFLLFDIVHLDSVYRMTYKQLREFKAENARQSIPFDFFEKHCHKASFSESGILNYLEDL